MSGATYQEVWERDQGSCVLCGINYSYAYSLDCHHIVFRSQGGAGTKENLALLCGPVTQSGTCHFKAHGVEAAEIRRKLQTYVAGTLLPLRIPTDFDLSDLF